MRVDPGTSNTVFLSVDTYDPSGAGTWRSLARRKLRPAAISFHGRSISVCVGAQKSRFEIVRKRHNKCESSFRQTVIT